MHLTLERFVHSRMHETFIGQPYLILQSLCILFEPCIIAFIIESRLSLSHPLVQFWAPLRLNSELAIFMVVKPVQRPCRTRHHQQPRICWTTCPEVHAPYVPNPVGKNINWLFNRGILDAVNQVSKR